MSNNRQQNKIPAPQVPVGDSSPQVFDNPGEAPQVQMIADAKAIQEQELASNEQASLEAEVKGLKGSVIAKDEDGKEVKASPMMVVATRPGFYKQSRKAEGDKFVIAGPQELGDWMTKI